MHVLILLSLGHTVWGSAGQTVLNALTGGLDEFIRRKPPGGALASPMYDRKTQAPLVWIHLRKSPRIVVDNEYYNLSRISGMNETNLTTVLVPIKRYVLPEIQHMMDQVDEKKHTSFIETKVDPLMILHGLFLAMPLRNPPQETVNVIAAEDTRSIKSIADTIRKKRETKRLGKEFSKMITEIATGG